MKPFRIPDESIGALDAATAARVLAASSDIALILDAAGVIQDIAIQPSQLALELDSFGRWIGRPWVDTVSGEGRPKVEALLEEAETSSASSWRQLSHATTAGREVAILYSATRIGEDGRKVALGRDMRNVVALQQRLIDAQMSMERDYAKLRFAETRYRLLFQTSGEPMLVVDGQNLKIIEANPAATALLEANGGPRLIGRQVGNIFAGEAGVRVETALSELRGAKQLASLDAELMEHGTVAVAATSFRSEGAAVYLLRLAQPSRGVPALIDGAGPHAPPLASVVRNLPDAFIAAEANGRILAANPAFAAMIEMRDGRELVGLSLDRWLGRPGVDLDLMMVNLRQHRTLRLFSTVLRTENGGELDVELNAVAIGTGKHTTYGFAIRDVGRRLKRPERGTPELSRSPEQLAELIGRVPLKEIVRETTDVIEKLCIEAALELTGDNRASAAELLGLSRQSLYVKLRRFGLAEGASEGEA